MFPLLDLTSKQSLRGVTLVSLSVQAAIELAHAISIHNIAFLKYIALQGKDLVEKKRPRAISYLPLRFTWSSPLHYFHHLGIVSSTSQTDSIQILTH